MDKEIISYIKESSLDSTSKTMLGRLKNRTDLTLGLTKVIFSRRAIVNKCNFRLHSRLSYLDDESRFKKNVRHILKRI